MAVTRSSARAQPARPSARAASSAPKPSAKRSKPQRPSPRAKKPRNDAPRNASTSESQPPPAAASDAPNSDAELRPVHYFLFKSESESRIQKGHEMKFSIDDLQNEPKCTAHWDGVRNAEASKCMRDMRKGDLAFFYHSNTKKTRPAIVGVVRVVSDPYPDHTAFDEADPHYDARSKRDAPRWYMVDVQFVRKFRSAVTLDQVKGEPKLANMQLVKRSRISVQRVTLDEWNVVHGLTT